jgi:hypothetical protein
MVIGSLKNFKDVDEIFVAAQDFLDSNLLYINTYV